MNPIPLIGGPADKTLQYPPHLPYITVAELPSLKVDEAAPLVKWFKVHRYERKYIAIGSGLVPIYVHESMTDREAIQTLIDSYAQQQK
jgi:hypothetical protein